MDKLYQNVTIFFRIFSTNNPNGICKSDSKTCQIFGVISIILICSLIISLIYLFLVGLGFLTSYILNYQSYDILSGCPLNDPNCSHSMILCNARNNGDIFGGCLASGLISGIILFFCVIIGIPIIFGIYTIIKEIYESFMKTKETELV